MMSWDLGERKSNLARTKPRSEDKRGEFILQGEGRVRRMEKRKEDRTRGSTEGMGEGERAAGGQSDGLLHVSPARS